MSFLRKIKKIVAGITTGVMLMCSCIGTFSASAATSTVVPGSKLAYNVSVDMANDASVVNSTKVRVSIQSTYNPGFYSLALGVKYDDGCVFSQSRCSAECTDGSYFPMKSANPIPDNNYVMYIMYVNESQRFYGNFRVDLYFDVSDWYVKQHTFSVVAYNYASKQESASISMKAVDVPDEFKKTDTLTDYTYILGDVDGSQSIEINDANLILQISSMGGSTYIDNYLVNENLRTSDLWKSKFPYLMLAEAADVDGDDAVEREDAQLVLAYTSQVAAGTDPVNHAIGTVKKVTI